MQRDIGTDTANMLVATRKMVGENDTKTKDIISDNDAIVKKTLEDNDAVLKANLLVESQKIELLMSEARRLQSILDDQHANFEERMLSMEQNIQVTQQVTGDPSAMRATATQLQGQDAQLRGHDEKIEQLHANIQEVTGEVRKLIAAGATSTSSAAATGATAFGAGTTAFGTATQQADPLQNPANDQWAKFRGANTGVGGIGATEQAEGGCRN